MRELIILLLFLNFLKIFGGEKMDKKIKLPEPRYKSDVSVEEAILKRRSVRAYKKEPIELKDLSQILWAAGGITDKEENLRASPSAGALYPLEIYVVVGEVNSLPKGFYKYDPFNHEILMLGEGDKREALASAALGQSWVKNAPIDILISGIYKRITSKYGERGIRYTYMEAGHMAQNIYLQAEALGLGTVVVGAFWDDKVKKVLGLPEEESPLYIMPLGKK
ncbi:MAG: SagB/ThcOx family dehydrogenase [candidate division WOR-3 bacterium]